MSVTSVRIATSSGSIVVIGEARGNVAVDGKASITDAGSHLTVQGDSDNLTVRVPDGIDVMIGSQSGSIEVRGRVGAVSAVAESGQVEIASARSVDVRAESGRVELGDVAESCCIRGNSGHVEVRGSGDVDVATTSGRIELRDVRGTVRAHCISGQIEVRMSAARDITAETVSGRIEVTLPAGTVVGVDCKVDARSLSGRVDVKTR